MQHVIKEKKKKFFLEKLEENIAEAKGFGKTLKDLTILKQRLLHQIFALKKMTVCLSARFPLLTTLNNFFQILHKI